MIGDMEKVSLEHPEFTQLSTEILGEGHRLRFTAHGSSMAPFIRGGDVLTVEPVESSQLRVGDIVFYRTEGDSLIAHRIIGIEKNNAKLKLRVRGDSSPGSEDAIAGDQILGRIEIVERGGKEIRINDGGWGSLGSIWVTLYPLPFITYSVLRKIGTILSPQVDEN
jgi:hypothetical protein